MRPLAHVCVLLSLVATSFAAEQSLVLKANMDVLRCTMPAKDNRFLASSAPGHLFLPGESAHITLALAKTDAKLAIEIQEITTRDPAARIKEAFTDTAGNAPLIGLEGKSIVHPIQTAFDDKPETTVEVKSLPIPEKFGTYALILVRGESRQFLGTVCRIPTPRVNAALENVPIFGEFGLLDRPERCRDRANTYYRMGVRGMRFELGWNESKDGKYDWSRLDQIFSALEEAHLQVMVTLGGHSQAFYPFTPDQTPASVAPNWDGSPYWGQADWLCDPKLYPRYGQWITALAQRYWKDGKGALWGFENYNEPWEGGGISGWARDLVQYRAIQKLIAESAWKVDRRIKICAASSIMNTEDKLFSEGAGGEMEKYVDVFTDHYVVPPMCYGPLVAAAHGKQSVETETWFVNSEALLPHIVQFLASGQLRLSPWHQRVLYDALPGIPDNSYVIPTPLVAATAAFNHFLTGKSFEKLVFHTHLPWVFQFGKDSDKDGLLIVFGQLMTIGGDDPKMKLWSQVETAGGGTITIDNADGLLKFHDLAANPVYVGQPSVTLPMSIFPTYITCDQGPAAAAARIKAAKIEGKRPVEILPHDFLTRVDAKDPEMHVGVHNCLNRAIRGLLTITGATRSAQLYELAAGETKTLAFPITSARPDPSNNYPCHFRFVSEAGIAEYDEVLNVTIAPKGTKKIDGNLDDWKDVPAITLAAAPEKAQAIENLHKPWLEMKDKQPDGTFAEVKFAWDDDFFYVAARVHDPTPQANALPMAGRNEDAYFHSNASDDREPYKTFLAKKHPGRSFAETPYVYCDSPEKPRQAHLPTIPFRRDRLQIALDVVDDWHDLKSDTDKVPYGFHAAPDTDYEYSLYWCEGDRSELWRHLAPGVPRIHDWPRQVRGQLTTGPVAGAKHVVRREGSVYIYEAAIPRQELAKFSLKSGTIFGLSFKAGNGQGPSVVYGADKAVCKRNGLTFHPYWEQNPSCSIKWALVD